MSDTHHSTHAIDYRCTPTITRIGGRPFQRIQLVMTEGKLPVSIVAFRKDVDHILLVGSKLCWDGEAGKLDVPSAHYAGKYQEG